MILASDLCCPAPTTTGGDSDEPRGISLTFPTGTLCPAVVPAVVAQLKAHSLPSIVDAACVSSKGVALPYVNLTLVFATHADMQQTLAALQEVSSLCVVSWEASLSVVWCALPALHAEPGLWTSL